VLPGDIHRVAQEKTRRPSSLAAVKPTSAILQAINNALPQLADAIPAVITACGAVMAALSHPPRLGRQK
jgi:hypothetical protein